MNQHRILAAVALAFAVLAGVLMGLHALTAPQDVHMALMADMERMMEAEEPRAASVPSPRPVPASQARAEPPTQPPNPGDTSAEDALPDATLALGSQAFAAGDMESARRYFRAIVDGSPDHSMAPYAAYKLAWCEANLGDIDAAIVEIQRTIRWLRDEGRPEEAVTLREALADLEHFGSLQDTG